MKASRAWMVILAVLLLAGAAIRGIACAALWPVATTLSDAAGYAAHAASNPLTDVQHPAGYAALLWLVGLVTRDVAVIVLLQHVLGMAAAVLLFAAVRRLVGSPWPALVPAAVVLLDVDELFLEHNVMSEGLFLFLLALTVYASVRAIDAPEGSAWRWSALAGVTAAAAAITRSPALFVLPVIALALLLGRSAGRPVRWRAPTCFVVVAIILLAGYGFANLQASSRFEVTPASGWHLYARVAPFADCRKFTPPAGTAGLCESTPAAARSGPDFYLYAARSPARRLFGRIGNRDAELRAFAVQAILHQPGDFAHTVWVDIRRYFVPASHPHGWYKGWDIDPQLDWSWQARPQFTRDTIAGMTRFFSPFVPHPNPALVDFMHAYGQVFGFGGTLLAVCTSLSLLGLLAARGRHRVGVLLFGIGGLAALIGPTVGVLYMGRYVVPLAGLIAAGAAISASATAQTLARRAARSQRVVVRSRAVARIASRYG